MFLIEIGQVFQEFWEGKETPNLVLGPGIELYSYMLAHNPLV